MNDTQVTIGKRFKNLTIPNVITYSGLLFALIGIYLLIKNQIILAIIFLTLTDVFDIADGYIARKFKMFSPIGADLDSLVDVMAFVVPPFIIALIFDSPILIMASVFMAGCGIYRLARFNIEKKVPGYRRGLTASLPPHFIYTALLLSIVPVYLSIFYGIFGIMMVSTVLMKNSHTRVITILIMVLNLVLATISLV